MDHFVIIVNGWKPLTIITKSFILDIAAVLDLLLVKITRFEEGLAQILKKNFLDYSSDLNHASLVLNCNIGISSDIVDKNYDLSKKATFSYFYETNILLF